MPSKRHGTLSLPFSVRAESDDMPALASYLFSLISIKQSNLCVSADVYSTTALLRLAEEVGDSICVLKTHADIIDDFSDRTIKGLQEIAKRKHFLLFEDRKFADIGSMDTPCRKTCYISNCLHLHQIRSSRNIRAALSTSQHGPTSQTRTCFLAPPLFPPSSLLLPRHSSPLISQSLPRSAPVPLEVV